MSKIILRFTNLEENKKSKSSGSKNFHLLLLKWDEKIFTQLDEKI